MSLSPEQEVAIEAACREHEAQHRRRHKKTSWVLVDPYFVRYGDPEILAAYVETQSCLYKTEPQTNKPRIPALIHYFENGQGLAYVVTEAIEFVQSPPDLDERIVASLTWLGGVPAPPEHRLGPLGSGYIRHSFFPDREAPLAFASVDALERYIEKGRKRLYNHGEGAAVVKLKEERLVCVQTEIDATHFGVDQAGNTVLMGLGSISFLPESFATYTFRTHSKFASVAKTLGLCGANNLQSMAKIAHNLAMTGDPSLGLDKYGNKDEGRGRS